MSGVEAITPPRSIATNNSDFQTHSCRLWTFYCKVSTAWVTAIGVLATALVIGAHQAGKFGHSPFSWQLCITLIVIFLSPALSRHQFWSKSNRWQLNLFWALWTLFCAGPVCLVFVTDLFTGHRKPGMKWYNGVWRIYAIVVLWIFLSLVLERYIKPFWRIHSQRILPKFRENSVAGRSLNIALDQQTAKLESIKEKVTIMLRRKKRLQSVLERKKEDIDHLKSSESGIREGESSADRLAVLSREAASTKDELDDIEDQLKMFQIQWTEALNITNHTGFYR